MSVKICCACKIEKNPSEFGKDSTSKDGLSYKCKICRNAYFRGRPKQKLEFTCKKCNITYLLTKGSIDRNKTGFCQKCCSIATQKGIARPQFSGKNSGRWTGGKYTSSDGYRMVKCENEFHPSGRQKYKREHILNVESTIGRELNTERGFMGEQVHHIDGDKLNNSVNNLEICCDMSDHQNLHAQLEQVAFDLVQRNIIKFCKKTRKYYYDIE